MNFKSCANEWCNGIYPTVIWIYVQWKCTLSFWVWRQTVYWLLPIAKDVCKLNRCVNCKYMKRMSFVYFIFHSRHFCSILKKLAFYPKAIFKCWIRHRDLLRIGNKFKKKKRRKIEWSFCRFCCFLFKNRTFTWLT